MCSCLSNICVGVGARAASKQEGGILKLILCSLTFDNSTLVTFVWLLEKNFVAWMLPPRWCLLANLSQMHYWRCFYDPLRFWLESPVEKQNPKNPQSLWIPRKRKQELDWNAQNILNWTTQYLYVIQVSPTIWKFSLCHFTFMRNLS